MRYEVLGPIRVIDSDEARFVSARKVEILLAVLVARRDQVVATDQLMTEIWGENPPRRANAALHVYVSQLRKFLRPGGRGPAAPGPAPAKRIVTRPLGYMLRLGDDELDVDEFQRSMRDGRAHAQDGRFEHAVRSLEDALCTWRAPALDDLREGVALYSYATFLEEARLECLETLVEAYLSLRRHREVIGRLYALTTQHPLRESFYRLLMLALFRADRQADALAVYHGARERLREELGLEPCRALQELNYAILVGREDVDRLAA